MTHHWSLILAMIVAAESLKKKLIFFYCIIYILKKLTIIKKLFYHILRARKILKINSSIQKISWENACVGGGVHKRFLMRFFSFKITWFFATLPHPRLMRFSHVKSHDHPRLINHEFLQITWFSNLMTNRM